MSHRAVVLLVVLAGCSRPPPPAMETGAAAAADTVAEGTVRLAGPRETAQLVLTGGAGSVGLTGPLSAEMRRLMGATLRVRGTPGPNPVPTPPRSVVVSVYEILDVDGQRPFIGIVVSQDSRFWLTGPDTLELVGVPPDFGARAGAKVFVVGVREGGRLRLKSYGVIREPR